MERIFVKPVDGKRCKDPSTLQMLPLAGKNVLKNSYWLRRIKDGDCVLGNAAVKAAPKPQAQPKPIKRKQKVDQLVEGDK